MLMTRRNLIGYYLMGGRFPGQNYGLQSCLPKYPHRCRRLLIRPVSDGIGHPGLLP